MLELKNISFQVDAEGKDKEIIREELETRFGYCLTEALPEVRQWAEVTGFDATWVSVPQAISVFLATDSFEDCLVQAIALGADADTQAAIACSIAEAYYGVEEALARQVMSFLEREQQEVLNSFARRYGVE